MNIARAIQKAFAYPGLAVGGFLSGVRAGLSTQWEGGESSRFRQRAPRALESQDRGLNYGVREDMLSESRSLAQTMPITRLINRKYANHVVSSCRMKWHTGDPAVDKQYNDAWQTWMRVADKGGRHHYRKLTKLAVEGVLRDAGVLGQYDRREGFTQIGIIEYDRISSNGIFNADVPGLIGGFGIDANGRETFARVWERTLYGYFINPQEIPRAQYCHVFDTDRYDACKGVTAYHTVLQATRDYKETANAEKLAAKRNSKLALIVKTMFGGAAAPAVSLFGGDETAGSGSNPAQTSVNTQTVNDVADAYMFPTEDMKAHVSDRPSDGWRWLMEQNIREIAAGLDLPFGVVWHMVGLGGPAARFEIAQANRVFMAFLNDIIEPMWHRPIVGAWVTMEIEQGRLPFTPFWFNFKCPRPKSITIDAGRDSKSGIAENAAGLSSATNWFADEDQDFEEETDRITYEAWYRRNAIQSNPKYVQAGVTLSEVRMLGATSTTRADVQETAEDQDATTQENGNGKSNPKKGKGSDDDDGNK